MEFIDTKIKQNYIGDNELITTGTTLSNGVVGQQYVLTSTFQQQHQIGSKTLRRYRSSIDNDSTYDKRKYYLLLDKKYFYTPKILEFRKNNVYKNQVIENEIPVIKTKNKNESLRHELSKWVNAHQWDYKCGINYQDNISFDGCSSKMTLLYKRISDEFKYSIVNIFYVTEKNTHNSGFHNHFVVSVTGVKNSNVKRKVKKLIQSIGSNVVECETFDPTRGAKLFEYMLKFIKANPDCYFWLKD